MRPMKEIVIEREARIGKDSVAPVPMSEETRRTDSRSGSPPIALVIAGVVCAIVMFGMLLALVT